MIKNIYKSYVSSIIGVLFLLGGVVYPFYIEEANEKIEVVFIVTGIVLLFLNEAKIKSIINKAVIKLTK